MSKNKFRVWDKRVNHMVYSDNYKCLSDFFNENIFDYHTNSNPKDTYKLMQYTGLKGKNGKEIYEGDIVKGEVGFQGKIMKVKGKVEYTHCRFVIAEYQCSLFQFSNDFAGAGFWINKIGNKYENPELLE